MIVYCVLCVGESEEVHIFSTKALAEQFADTDPRPHVLYDYLVDHPERMTELSQ